MSSAGPTPALLRLCLDLNVWVADFLGIRLGRRGGSSPWLADAVRSSTCQAGPLQLVVSLGMLDRLALVLTREFQVEADAAETLVRAIGGGVYPLRDEEDRHVLEAAIAGEADLLVTANMADFGTADILKVGDGTRIRLYPRLGQAALVIAHPDQARDWLRSGVSPLAAIEPV